MALQNIYFVLRHGESISSRDDIVASIDAAADNANTLTLKGLTDIQISAKAWIYANRSVISEKLNNGKLVIYTSKARRARQSAEILADEILAHFRIKPKIIAVDDLAPRNFGQLSGKIQASTHYEKVYRQDAANPQASPAGVESRAHVQQRMSAFVARLEQNSPAGDKLYILVSHGGPLSVLQTAFQNIDVTQNTNPFPPRFRRSQIKQLVQNEMGEFIPPDLRFTDFTHPDDLAFINNWNPASAQYLINQNLKVIRSAATNFAVKINYTGAVYLIVDPRNFTIKKIFTHPRFIGPLWQHNFIIRGYWDNTNTYLRLYDIEGQLTQEKRSLEFKATE